MTNTHRRLIILAVVAVLVVILWGVGPLPDASEPPAWLTHFARHLFRVALPVIYWGGGAVILAYYGVLFWQRRVDETSAARWNRRLMLWLAVLLLAIAAGDSLFQAWRLVAYAAAFVAFAVVICCAGLALAQTYIYPVWLCRGDRCEQVPPPVDGGGVLPKPPERWDGTTERRTGPVERRRRRPPGGMTPA